MAGKVPGAAVLVISNPLATRVVGAMLGESAPAPEVVQDGIEEIINIIAGRARAALEKTAHGFEIALVTTVCGHEQMARPGKKCCQVWSIPFYVEDGEFILELRIADEA
jgi:CheY-specific phosphatase CheX